jgi:hypothetical protein
MILLPFKNFPAEAEIIGRLLAGYGELEAGLVTCVQAPSGNFDSVFKAIFQHRQLTERINKAEHLGSAIFKAMNLGNDFDEAIASMRHCRTVRNQYIHSAWWLDPDPQRLGHTKMDVEDFFKNRRLAYTDLEDLAKQNVVIPHLHSIPPKHVDLQLLQDQDRFFTYTSDLLSYLTSESQTRAGRPATRRVSRPRQISPPPPHIP